MSKKMGDIDCVLWSTRRSTRTYGNLPVKLIRFCLVIDSKASLRRRNQHNVLRLP